ncbi:hypothetical protein [Nitrospirillum iridis]|uniref:Putative methyltransferase n=1 Tax=Nitrospirillum iridis TaxID=765888 RepID=A0A7X0AZV4_9PROT|nr:hypothetical protein [Nitrospirillum iridis]MBB6253174.1 putative methyltransferase [Nitrospirillum iridis]
MYDQSKLSELIRFAQVELGSTVIDVYPGDGDWTRLFSGIVGPEGRVFSFVPAEVADFKNDPVGRMRTSSFRSMESVTVSDPGRCRCSTPDVMAPSRTSPAAWGPFR